MTVNATGDAKVLYGNLNKLERIINEKKFGHFLILSKNLLKKLTNG